jgi:hypothetical protein
MILFRATALLVVVFSTVSFFPLGAEPASHDKLSDLGLDAEGRPWPSQRAKSSVPVVLLPTSDGYVTIKRPELLQADTQDLATRARAILQAVLEGYKTLQRDDAATVAFPLATSLSDVVVRGDEIAVYFTFPDDFVSSPAAVQARFDRISEAVIRNLQQLPVRSFAIYARAQKSTEFVPLDTLLPHESPPPVDTTPDTAKAPAVGDQATSPSSPPAPESEPRLNQYPRPAGLRPTGALTGKAVYLNPGHGWTWRDTSDYWGLQRGFSQENIEDFSNVELVNQWVWAYCYNAGADVFSVRESDFNPNMVVVDNDDGWDGTKGYYETGSGWFNSSLAGYKNGFAPYPSGVDPFTSGTNRLVQCVTGTPTATARWVPQIPADGWYNVYVTHGAYTNRSPQAHYRIYHAGGSTDAYVDQRMRRFTWIYLGTFYFESGVNQTRASVELLNDSSSTTHYVSADAVRFGGGMGLITRGNAGTSGKPRFEEEARYHIQYSGAPSSLYDGSGNDEQDGWPARPRFGRWLRDAAVAYGAPAQDSVFISSHTNAFDGTARGMDTYVYTGYEGTWHDTFRNFVHDEVLNDCQKGYSSQFINHGIGKRYGTYSENSPSNVGDLMPIFLGEWLFHDNATDMALYHDPKFRQVMGRAIYQGIVKFWANRNGTPVYLLPEPPRNFRVVQTGPTSVRLQWDQPLTDSQGVRGDAATGYRLYVSSHGRAFPAPIEISGGATTTYVLSGLTPDTNYFFYVTATNQGGESFPTEVMAVRTSSDPQAPKVLIVNGFDKLDIATRQAVPWSGSTLYRQRLAKMNTFDYITEHANAVAAWGRSIAFDSCEDEAIELNYVDLANYAAVIWIGGIQAEVSTTDPTTDISITPVQQTKITNYLNAGGKLFISGAEIAWDLDRGGSTTFVDTVLRANYVADSSGVNTVLPATGNIFAGLGSFAFDDGTGPRYAVRYPDVITTSGGSLAALYYGGGSSQLDDFETIGGWKDPNYSSQTNADAASAFSIATTPVLRAAGSGDLYYVWGTGNFIRLYNSALPELPAASTFSIWIYGDGSGHSVRIALRDSDNEIYVNNWLMINFTGWREIRWNLQSDPATVWANASNNVIDGPNVRFDSIQVSKTGSANEGHLYFDDARFTMAASTTGAVAGVQYAGSYKLVYLAFPFETIVDEDARDSVMKRTLDFFFPPPFTPAYQDALTTAAGWNTFVRTPNNATSVDYVQAHTALRASVVSDPSRYRVAGWMTDSTKWLPYSAVGTDKYVRGKFYVYGSGSSFNAIPNLRLRLAVRYAQNAMLEVFNHTNMSASDELLEQELRPSTDPTKPSLYRVDFDPVDVPYLLANGGTEGIAAGFEAYATFPQDSGYIALTELVLGTYPASTIPNSVAPVKTFAPTSSDAGELASSRPGAVKDLFSMVFTSGTEGDYGVRDNNYAPAYAEGPFGVTVSSEGFNNQLGGTRLGVAAIDFGTDANYAARLRVEPGKQYKIRFHASSTSSSNRNPQLRFRARSIRFSWSQKLEIGGALSAGTINNTIAAQALPGIGSSNPDKLGSETTGGWYTMIFHTPMSLDIRPDISGDLSARMPNITAEPGPGLNSPSRRDLRVGFDLLDTLSPPPNGLLEEGNFTIDRIEIRAYPLVTE